MQNCEEKIPILDLTDFKEIENVIYVVSQACIELAKENRVVIKIIKNES